MADEQELWQERLAKRRAGTPWSAIAKGEGISRGTFNEHLRRAGQVGWIPPEEELPPAIRSDGRRVGLPGSGTHKVPDEEPSRYLEGTHQALQNVAEPMGTDKVPKESSEPIGTHGVPMRTSAPESTLPEPAGTLQDVDRRSESRQWSGSSHDLLMMVSKQADDHDGKLRALTDHIYMLEVQTSERFRVLESAMQEYARHLQPVPVDRYSRVKPSLPAWTRNLAGIPGYPTEPHKDSRLNIHLPEEERWLINAIADGLDVNISSLVRRILTEWSQGDEAQKGLRAHLERRGIHEGTVMGTEEEEADEDTSPTLKVYHSAIATNQRR